MGPNNKTSKLLIGRVIDMDLKEQKILFSSKEKSNNENEWIKYDYCIISSGCQYKSNQLIKPPRKSITFQQRVEKFKEMNEKLNRVQNIVIVGSGAVGVEICALLCEYYYSKSTPSIFTRAKGILLGKWLPFSNISHLCGKLLLCDSKTD